MKFRLGGRGIVLIDPSDPHASPPSDNSGPQPGNQYAGMFDLLDLDPEMCKAFEKARQYRHLQCDLDPAIVPRLAHEMGPCTGVLGKLVEVRGDYLTS